MARGGRSTIPGDSTYAHWLSYFQSGDPNVRVAAFLSTHLLVVDKPETAELAVCAMKLLRSTRWTPYIGFSEPKLGVLPDVFYSHPCPYWGGEPISLRGSALVDMRRLFAAIRRGQSREKDRTLRAMFLYAESHDVPSYSLRYFQHCTILEVLFLPQRVTELSYRFQLRIAKWFHANRRADVKMMALRAKKVYDTRSAIAHRGEAKVTENDLREVAEMSRVALRAYLLDPSTFTHEYLDNLCLGVVS